VHRQCIVNLHHAVRLQRNNEGYWSLRMSGIPSPVAVSRRSVPAVKTRLEEIRAQQLK
ncbi:MAG: LytTR family transcriptional regulator, partial [bacterium]|nr:LytTR family transcriptional regulator [bacterium]